MTLVVLAFSGWALLVVAAVVCAAVTGAADWRTPELVDAQSRCSLSQVVHSQERNR